MNRFFKAVAALVSIICVTAGTLIFAAACQDDPATNKKYYTVTISYPDIDGGNGAGGIDVTLSPLNGNAYINNKDLKSATDSNGKAVFDITDWADTTSYSVEIDFEDIPSGYSVISKHTVNIKDGYELNLKLNAYNFQSIHVNLSDKNETIEFEPSSRFADGYYEFRCSNSNVMFTLSDGNTEHPGTFYVNQGSSTVLVEYTSGVIYDIGTANDITDFEVVFAPVSSTGAQDAPHAVDMSKTLVLELNANESSYLSNAQEVDIPGVKGGAPCFVSGENFRVEVDGKTYTQDFKIAGGKTLKVSTANDTAGTVVLNFSAIKSSDELTVGEIKKIEIALMNRTILTQTPNADVRAKLIWEVSSFKLNFNAETAGQYKITIKSDFANDKVFIQSLNGVGANFVSIQPEKVDGNAAANNPFTSTYEITTKNLNIAKNYVFDLTDSVTDFETAGYKEGDIITYSILVEKL